ncbi:MAG TPA: agmatine deiminase family protein [Candidatus Acidoferrum sp.]|nr:agmatine deiminase family protein [Candidatus Acidoferrum sp.]
MQQKFEMLPEWAPQQAVMLAWPHESTDWAPWLEAIQRDYVELAAAISGEATPVILCQDAAHRQLIERQLGGRCKMAPRFVIAPYNDTWCRDYGPVTLARGDDKQLLDFQFNGWGDKYDAALDNNINQQLASLWRAPLRTINYELEGGSIETDGQGSLLTTAHCLLDSNRNNDFTKEQVEQFVLNQLGLSRILWITEGALLGDDTDSHIDNLVRFCSSDTIAYATCSRQDDVHYAPMQKMKAQVEALRQPNGQPYKLEAIEIPAPQFDEHGKRLPGSYVNFLILNHGVIVPVFGCDEDAAALAALQRCFPGRKIVAVPGGNLIKQYGGPHCATMQLPVGTLVL